jgi:hypothetical protein
MIWPSLQRADVPVLPSVGIADLVPDDFAAVFIAMAGFAGVADFVAAVIAAGAAVIAAGLDMEAAEAVPVPFMQPDINAL